MLKVNKVRQTIDPGIIDEEKNNLGIGLLFQSTPEALILQVGDLDTAKSNMGNNKDKACWS